MNNPIQEPLKTFLYENGITSNNLSLSTRLYHDLGIYGDTAFWLFEDIESRGVDLKNFVFDKYFPPEVYGNSIFSRFFYATIPFANAVKRKKCSYQPLTLAMIRDCLDLGVFVDPS